MFRYCEISGGMITRSAGQTTRFMIGWAQAQRGRCLGLTLGNRLDPRADVLRDKGAGVDRQAQTTAQSTSRWMIRPKLKPSARGFQPSQAMTR